MSAVQNLLAQATCFAVLAGSLTTQPGASQIKEK